MKVVSELVGEPVIHMRVVAVTGEQHHSVRHVRAAPVQNLELDSAVDRHACFLVRSRIDASSGLRSALFHRRA